MNKEERAKALHKSCDELAKQLTDEGKLIESGWQIMRVMMLPPELPADQSVQMRKAFFLGAQHLYASMIGIMDADREPTEKDIQRMGLIHTELEAFRIELGGARTPASDL
jgi:hypothetical protein